MIRVVFVGTPDFSLKALEVLHADKELEVSLVITGEDRRRSRNRLSPTVVKEYALAQGLPVITPKNINSEETIAAIDKVDPDFIVVVAYGQLIGKKLLNKYQDRILNIHSSILPKYRGAAPINWAIVDGEKESGVTIMLVDEGMDTGDILKINRLAIGSDEKAGRLHDRLALLGGRMLVQVLKDFSKYYENRQPQEEKLASYCSKINRKMGEIDFHASCQHIYNKFRGFYPWPGSYFYYFNQMVKVHEMSYQKSNHSDPAGLVKEVTSEGIKIACADGYIILKEIQFPNKRKMDVASFLLGNEFQSQIIIGKKDV